MNKFGKVLRAALAVLVCVFAVGAAAPAAQAAKWKTMKESTKMEEGYYSRYKKTKKVRLTLETKEGIRGTYTFKVSKIQSDIKKLRNAMRKGKKATFTYKSGKRAVTLKLTKNRTGSFVISANGKALVTKDFTYKKINNGKFVLTSKDTGKKMTMTLTYKGKRHSWRLFEGESTKPADELAHIGITKGKYVYLQSRLEYFNIVKAEYK